MNDKTPNSTPPEKGKIPPSGGMSGSIKILMLMLVIVFIFNLFSFYTRKGETYEIPYSTYLELLNDGKITKIEVKADRLIIYPDYSKIDESDELLPNKTLQSKPKLYALRISDPTLKEDLREHDVDFMAIADTSPLLYSLLNTGIMILLVIGSLVFMSRIIGGKMGDGMFGGKSNAKVYMQKETGITFNDVAGQDEAKESLEEIIDFLHNPEKYKKIGARQPKGALLVGPPGTGKTLLAKAVAGEANVTFISISGSDFDEVYVGVGASRVRDLFKQANQHAPCIIFIDEIDAVGRSRNEHSNYNEQTLNQLLSEMDGFDTSKGIVILAATNRPEVLDKALLRPGRFDRRIIVEKPDLIGRENILKVHSKNVILSKDVDMNKIALITTGFAGADLANVVNEAALRAVKFERNEVLQEDLMEAIEVVIAGKEKKDRVLSDKEKNITAYHEVGHALASALQKDANPVQKITIVPRTMGSLGYMLSTPEEEKYIKTKSELMADIVVSLAGRAAEEIKFNEVSTGASNDIETATQTARRMVSIYGMTEAFDMMALESVQGRYLDNRLIVACSHETETILDQEVLKIIKECHEMAKKILNENLEALDKVAEFLLEKESITGDEFMKILKKVNGEDVEDEPDSSENAFNTDDNSDSSKESIDTDNIHVDITVGSSESPDDKNISNDIE